MDKSSANLEILKDQLASAVLQELFAEHSTMITPGIGLEFRIKSEESAKKKLEGKWHLLNGEPYVNDLIGGRIVVAATEQIEAAVETVQVACAKCGLEALSIERLLDGGSTHGYRAVHLDYIIRSSDPVPMVIGIEFQITTMIFHVYNGLLHEQYKSNHPKDPPADPCFDKLSSLVSALNQRFGDFWRKQLSVGWGKAITAPEHPPHSGNVRRP